MSIINRPEMFNQHGSFRVELIGNILQLEIEGAWNLETTIAYKNAISQAILPISGKPWATLTLMDDWELCTPDSELLIVEIVKDAIAKGLVREAVVNNNGLIKLQLFEKYKNIDMLRGLDTPLVRHIYKDQVSALDWLAKHGFHWSA